MRYLKAVFSIGLACLVLTAWSQPPGRTPKVDIFSAPNAGTGPWQGTFAQGITPNGTVGGYYVDANGVNHGFIRTLDGTLTAVDVPEAGGSPGQGTQIFAMNYLGESTGWYIAADGGQHPFLRSPLGKITLFDVPGALGAQGQNINDAGTIAGAYVDGSLLLRGFLRTRSGELSTYDIPGACANCWNVQMIPWYTMNQPGAIIGTYLDGKGVAHGWIRTPQGLTNEFNAAGAGTTAYPQGTWPYGINPQGAIVGNVFDENSISHAFLRDQHGNYTTFDAPGSENGGGTGPEAINAANTITGNYWDASGTNYGFIRAKDGTFTEFDLPGAGHGDYRGTIPTGINPQGWIAGTIIDDNFVSKSFVMIP